MSFVQEKKTRDDTSFVQHDPYLGLRTDEGLFLAAKRNDIPKLKEYLSWNIYETSWANPKVRTVNSIDLICLRPLLIL